MLQYCNLPDLCVLSFQVSYSPKSGFDLEGKPFLHCQVFWDTVGDGDWIVEDVSLLEDYHSCTSAIDCDSFILILYGSKMYLFILVKFIMKFFLYFFIKFIMKCGLVKFIMKDILVKFIMERGLVKLMIAILVIRVGFQSWYFLITQEEVHASTRGRRWTGKREEDLHWVGISAPL